VSEFNRGSFGERISMTCQVCRGTCHGDVRKEVFVQDPATSAYKKAVCPMCLCLDCVQKEDNPIRAQLRPRMMGQTLRSQYNLNVDEFKPGEAPTKRNIHIKAPGPLDVPAALKAMGDLLGLQSPESPPRHRLPQAVGCGCGKNATSKCISCEMPLCMKCLKSHDCDEG
jgi:hypothetical protein